jgi:hypothetical protein
MVQFITRASSLDDGTHGRFVDYLMKDHLSRRECEIQSTSTLREVIKMKLFAILTGAVAVVSAAYPGDIVQYWYVKPTSKPL